MAVDPAGQSETIRTTVIAALQIDVGTIGVLRTGIDQRVKEIAQSDDFNKIVSDLVVTLIQGMPNDESFKVAVTTTVAPNIGAALVSDAQFVTMITRTIDPTFTGKLEERLTQAGKTADHIFTDVQTRMNKLEQHLANTQDAAKAINVLSGKIDHTMSAMGEAK